MQVLITDEELAAQMVRQRQADGIAVYDELWEGVYHVVPAGSRRHGEAQAAILTVLREWTWPRVATAVVTGPVNIGSPNNYRVPDAAVLADILSDDDVFIPTALMVVEVLSPGDDSFKKFDFYLERGVKEILIVDPQARTVELHAAEGIGYAVVDDSAALGMANAAPQLARAMGW